jgi:hypothetical protein
MNDAYRLMMMLNFNANESASLIDARKLEYTPCVGVATELRVMSNVRYGARVLKRRDHETAGTARGLKLRAKFLRAES